MGVFQGNIPTSTRSNKGGSDSAAPDFGKLNPKAMTSATGLSGTDATDAKLIHGDRWQQIDGKQTEKIDKDLKTDVMENEEWTVHEDLDFKVNGKTTDNRIEDVKEYYHAESRFEYFGEHTDQHHEQDHQINPTHTFDILNVEGEFKTIDLAIKASSIEAKGLALDATITKGESWVGKAEAWVASVGAGVFVNEAVLVDVGEKELEERLHGIDNKIAGLNAQVGVARTIIMPVRVGICIAVHIDSPWA